MGKDENDARPPRRVSIRRLFRDGTDLLDEVELDGAALVLTRHGRAIAMVTPVASSMPRRIRRGSSLPQEEPLPEVETDNEEEKVLLIMAAQVPTPWTPSEIEQAKAIQRLEEDGLVVSNPYFGYDVTSLGLRHAVRLRDRGVH